MTSSGVQHNAMTPWDFARDITAFAESANIDSTAAPGLDMLIGARLVSSFAHVDRRAVFERVASVKAQSAGMHTWAAHTSIDWDVLETHLSTQRHASAHSPAAFWLRLLEYIKFENESAPAEDVAQYIIKLKNNVQVQVPASCSPLDGVRIALQRSGAGAKLDWHTVCSSFILLHVVHEDAAAAIAMHLRSTPQKEVCVPVANEDVGSKLARHLMSFRHTPANIEHTLVALLTAHAHFNTEKLAALLHTFREESARIRVDSQTLFKRFQRVSLTALAQSGNGPTAICSDSTSFAAFVAACRFPMHVPASLQRYVYFLKSMQTRVCLDGTVVTARIERLLQNANVAQVDVGIVQRVIATAVHAGEPTAALQAFRASCILPFFSNTSARRFLTWTVVLRLYLAAYQSTPAVQQACWNSVLKRVYSGLADECNSTETTAALAAYTASSAFDASVLVPVEAASFTV